MPNCDPAPKTGNSSALIATLDATSEQDCCDKLTASTTAALSAVYNSSTKKCYLKTDQVQGAPNPNVTLLLKDSKPTPGPTVLKIKCDANGWYYGEKKITPDALSGTSVNICKIAVLQGDITVKPSGSPADAPCSDPKAPLNQRQYDPSCGYRGCTLSSTDTGCTVGPLTVDRPLCLASTTKIPKLVNGNVQHVELKDLHDGDMIRTTRGDYPLSHIMHTTTIGPHTYVKVEKGSLGENTPSQDLYLTHEHSFSLGYYKNSVLNRNIHDPAQDDMTYLHITADQLADKLPGITRVQKEFDAMFNLVFDEHVSLDIYGLEVMMHHPKGNPYTLPEEKYQDKSKINNKVQKPLFAHYGMLENVKPEHMEMKDFLRGCITANLDNKFRIEDVNHPSFAPQKTMISQDIREKLRVA